MRLKGRFRLSFTNVLATVALFAALAGTSYAAIQVTGKNIKDNSVTSAKVRDLTLNKGDFGKGLFESAKAAPLSSAAFEADRDAGPAGVPAGDYVTVATLNLQPGAYAIFAKTDISSDQLDASRCQLAAGARIEQSARGLRSNGTAEAQNLQLAYTFASPGAITLSCKTSDGSWTAADTKILAVRVDSQSG
jgi:uncharacterized protein (DUF2141 family)